MDEDMFLHEYKDAQITNAMAVVGFPSVGLVSSIAANYIVRRTPSSMTEFLHHRCGSSPASAYATATGRSANR
jgi:predicted ATP-grasp superfamily ATP-dependent carboligase